MEKRPKKTLPQSLSLIAFCIELALVAILFVPILVVMEHRPQRQNGWTSQRAALRSFLNWEAATETAKPSVSIPEQPPSKELIRIYSIVKSHRPDISEAEAMELAEVIWEECSWYGLDPLLVLAVINVESKFQYRAVSPKGARGIMQILPYVGKSLIQEIGLHQPPYAVAFKPEFLDDPFLNIKLGVFYLHGLRKSFRNLTHALTAYNMGPTETKNRLENDIEFSKEYATLVLASYQQYKTENTKRPTF
ncbi:MAG TPA: lytic transglycosylase domain-containing protein [Candidatus Binatia bacterium]|nr:lytic transglycosylase domain-containing protein [Candidatus Binatia bacterium]